MPGWNSQNRTMILILWLAGIAGWSSIVTAQSQSGPTYSGQAAAVRATILGFPAVVADTGPLAASGGAKENGLNPKITITPDGSVLLEVCINDSTCTSSAIELVMGLVHAATVGQQSETSSEAALANFKLTWGDLSIAADFLMANARTVCSASAATVDGNSQITNLILNGAPVSTTIPPNYTLNLPNGKIIINEQTIRRGANSANASINVLHVVMNGIADIIVGPAEAGITCGVSLPDGVDLASGSGWITGTPSGGMANLGVAGGVKSGAFWGHLNYSDITSNLKVKGTSITGYSVLGPTGRRIEGFAEINGQPGYTYRIDLYDDSPNGHDSFVILLSNGYAASGPLGGGDIRIH